MTKNSDNIKNPFTKKCENCTTNMWEYLKNKNEQEKTCTNNTYVKIEKFKDDG